MTKKDSLTPSYSNVLNGVCGAIVTGSAFIAGYAFSKRVGEEEQKELIQKTQDNLNNVEIAAAEGSDYIIRHKEVESTSDVPNMTWEHVPLDEFKAEQTQILQDLSTRVPHEYGVGVGAGLFVGFLTSMIWLTAKENLDDTAQFLADKHRAFFGKKPELS